MCIRDSTCIILVLEYTYLILVLGYTYVIPVLGYTYIILVLGYTCIILVWCSASWELVQRKVPTFVRVSASVVIPKGDAMYSLHGVFCSFLFRSVCGLEKNVLTEIMQFSEPWLGGIIEVDHYYIFADW